MSIIYIHGVKVRSPEHGKSLERPMLTWLGPHVAAGAQYLPVYWGGLCADQFRWELASRPRSALLGQGATTPAEAIGLARSASRSLELMPTAPAEVVDDAVLGGASTPQATAPDVLSGLTERDRPDAVAALYLAYRARTDGAPPQDDVMLADPRLGALAAAAQSVADRWETVVAGSVDDAHRTAALVAAVEGELGETLIAAGAMDSWVDRAGEVLQRAVSAPGDVVSSVLGEARPVVNEFVANFLGDVLTYLSTRDASGEPGPIPQTVLAALRTAEARRKATGEPIVIVTHSMGGQLLYDALTFYAPEEDGLKDLEIAHWLSCGCQVSFFAELGLFEGQPSTRAPSRLPMPLCVAKWTNYFDINDLVGFILQPVFEGPRDVAYDTGYGLALAHTGYFTRPSFFGAMAKALSAP